MMNRRNYEEAIISIHGERFKKDTAYNTKEMYYLSLFDSNGNKAEIQATYHEENIWEIQMYVVDIKCVNRHAVADYLFDTMKYSAKNWGINKIIVQVTPFERNSDEGYEEIRKKIQRNVYERRGFKNVLEEDGYITPPMMCLDLN